jgi:hypothetical protein
MKKSPLADRLLSNRCMAALLRKRPQRSSDLESVQADWQAAIAKWRQLPPEQPAESLHPAPAETPAEEREQQAWKTLSKPPQVTAASRPPPLSSPRRGSVSVPQSAATQGHANAADCLSHEDDATPSLQSQAVSSALPMSAAALPPPAEAKKKAAPMGSESPAPQPSPSTSSFPPLLEVDVDDHVHKVPSLFYLTYRETLKACQAGEFAKAANVLSHIIDSVGNTAVLGAIVYGNRSVCNYALRNYHLCAKDCTEAMSRSFPPTGDEARRRTYVSALMRRAYCHVCLRNSSSARVDIAASERLQHPLAAPLRRALERLEQYDALMASRGTAAENWKAALEAIQAVCSVVRDPSFEASLVEAVAMIQGNAAALALCSEKVLEFHDNSPELWYWFGRLQYMCAVDTAGLSDVQRVLHRAIGMAGIDGHVEAKRLLQSVRSCESKSAVAAAFTGTKRWEQAITEYTRLLASCGCLPPLLKAHFLIRKAWVAALGTPAVHLSHLRDALDSLRVAEELLPSGSAEEKEEGKSSSRNGRNPPSASPLREELMRCRVELLLGLKDFPAAAAAAKAAVSAFPQSNDVKKLYARALEVISVGSRPASAGPDRPFRPASSPRAGTWAQNRRCAGMDGDAGEQLNSEASSSSASEDDDFSSLNASSFKKASSRARDFAGFRPQSARSGCSASGGPKPQRPSSARPVVIQRQPEYYQLLGIAPTTPTAGVVKAYRELALRWHPDRWSGSGPELKLQAEATFKRIQQAYSVLGDAAARMAYDMSLGL